MVRLPGRGSAFADLRLAGGLPFGTTPVATPPANEAPDPIDAAVAKVPLIKLGVGDIR